MHLNACAIELEFEGGFAEQLHGLGSAFGRRCQHRLNGPEQLDRIFRQCRNAVAEGRFRDFAEIAGHHRRLTDRLDRRI